MKVEDHAIGAGYIDQAMKAMVSTKQYLLEDGIDAIFSLEIVNLYFDGRLVTAIKIIIDPNK